LTRSGYRPKLWIIAGPNGCGKSTFYDGNLISGFDGSVWIINPDALTRALQADESLSSRAANLEAVKRIERWLHASLDVHQTIGVETVLSTDKYRRLVTRAKQLGYEVRLIYIFVDSARRQLERIRIRVAKGGHDVPKQKVIDRRKRSLEQLGWFFWEADFALLYDNSSATPKLLAEKTPSGAEISGDLPEEVFEHLIGSDKAE
jgi:predicted ABC-type ATPase